MMNNNFNKKRFILFPFFALLFISIGGWTVMFLWNAILPAAISFAHPINYWQAIGLLFLCRLLFGGFKGGGHRFKGNGPFQNRAQWKGMSEEEREKFRAEWRARCGKG